MKYSLLQILQAYHANEFLGDEFLDLDEMIVLMDNDTILIQVNDQTIYSDHPSSFWPDLLSYHGIACSSI